MHNLPLLTATIVHHHVVRPIAQTSALVAVDLRTIFAKPVERRWFVFERPQLEGFNAFRRELRLETGEEMAGDADPRYSLCANGRAARCGARVCRERR